MGRGAVWSVAGRSSCQVANLPCQHALPTYQLAFQLANLPANLLCPLANLPGQLACNGAFQAAVSTCPCCCPRLPRSRADLCGAPANTTGWFEPGWLHAAVMRGLEPSTRFFYQYGDPVRLVGVVRKNNKRGSGGWVSGGGWWLHALQWKA